MNLRVRKGALVMAIGIGLGLLARPGHNFTAWVGGMLFGLGLGIVLDTIQNPQEPK